MQTDKRYIGDETYVEFDSYNIILTTENGIRVNNTIILEPEVVKTLIRYIEEKQSWMIV